MDSKKSDPNSKYYNKDDEGDIVVDAYEAPGNNNGINTGPPIPPGHSRFYCEKCRTPYDLPGSATSWRCSRCQTFNSTTPGECGWCSIL